MNTNSIILFLNNKFNLVVYFSILIFLNIIVDYFFDTGKLKSKDFWEANMEKSTEELKKMNKSSYSAALSAAAFIWSFVLHIPIIVLIYYFNISIEWYKLLISLLILFLVHRNLDNNFTNNRLIGFWGLQFDYLIITVWYGFIWIMILSK